MMRYKPTIGLEIHAQLLTKTKAFCSCSAEIGDAMPNSNICPVCTGQPGALPVLNSKAVEYAVKAALALNCTVNQISSFDRKNYFYPDLPKGYQITQYFRPIANNGFLFLNVNSRKKKIRINRLHIEEDAGKLTHLGGNIEKSVETLVDYNRSGIPLIEIVTEPDIESPEEAHVFMENIRNTLRYIKICSGDLEKGALRCDANISVTDTYNRRNSGRVEIKNINSFKYVQKALEYEYIRLSKSLERNEISSNETRGWNNENKCTFEMRKKESGKDYRYFPDPDLPVLSLKKYHIEKIKETVEELPAEKIERFRNNYYLSDDDIQIYINDVELSDFFEKCVVIYRETKKINSWLLTEVKSYLNRNSLRISETLFKPEKLIELLKNINSGRISNNIGKSILPILFTSDKSVLEIIKENKVEQITDEKTIKKLIEDVLLNNHDKVESYKHGKKGLFKFFIGEVMKKTKGKSNPILVREILEEMLKDGEN